MYRQWVLQLKDIVYILAHTLLIVALGLATLQALALQEDFPDADFLWKQEAPKWRTHGRTVSTHSSFQPIDVLKIPQVPTVSKRFGGA